MFSPLVLSLGDVFALTPQQQNDSILYLQSLLTPLMFEHCKTLQPDRAATYDEAWTAWSRKNRRGIARGKKTVHELGDTSAAADRIVHAEAEATVAEVRKQPVAEQEEYCDRMFGLAQNES